MEELSFLDYFAIFKRRLRIFLLTAGLLSAVAVLFVMHWSNYRAMATVEIQNPQIPPDVATPIGMSQNDMLEALADQRISQIEQQVTSTASLVDIITKYDLYPGPRKKTPIADIADSMRKKIKVGLVSSALANPAAANKETPEQLSAIAFTVSYDYGDPLITQQVTNELVTRFLDEDLKMRREQAQETSAFLGAQIAALESTMTEQEKKIADYHATHENSRPESLVFNQQAIQTTALNMQSLDSQIAANEGTQGSLRSQLANIDPYSRVIADGQVLTTPAIQLKALEAQYATLTAQYGADHPDVVKVRHQIDALRTQVDKDKSGHPAVDTSVDSAQLKAKIIDTRTNLEAAQKTEGAENPDVISLKHQLASLEQQLATQGKETSHSDMKADADNPAYLELEAQLKAAEEQHKSLLEQRVALQGQQTKYQKALAETPASEEELASLSRDYENAQLRLRELTEKKMAADMEGQMEADRKGQRLVVIDPPRLPLGTHPGRMLLLLGGLMVAFMGGIGSVVIAEAMGQSVHGAAHVTSLVGVAPLVCVPYIYASGERGFMRRLTG